MLGNMLENMLVKMQFLLLVAVCWTCMPVHVTAFEVEFKQDVCPNLVLTDTLQPSIAYNVAYDWNRFGRLRNWHFEEDSSVGSINGMQCVKQEFDTTLSLPHVFSEYINSLNFDVHISKKICVKKNVMTELVHVDDVARPHLRIIAHQVRRHLCDVPRPEDAAEVRATVSVLDPALRLPLVDSHRLVLPCPQRYC